MPRPRNAASASSSATTPPRGPTRGESAQYIYDMLISLKNLPTLKSEAQLMRLIEAAAEEALTLAKRETA